MEGRIGLKEKVGRYQG